MAKGSRGRRRIASRQYRSTPYPLPSCSLAVPEDMDSKHCSKPLEKKDWVDATCSVCMEYPHNAVLLLCSSHDKGCRPYMCGTSFRYSNCLDQYKKAHTKVISHSDEPSLQGSIDNPIAGSVSSWPIGKSEVTDLTCPLCRGHVKGWAVVEPAREYLDSKKRSCMQDDCSFVGCYKELRKHVKAEHPSARPREVDPVLEQKWRRLQHEQERDDVISTITSSMPGAMVFGDYVIEGNHYDFDSDDEEEDYFDSDPSERGNTGVEVGFDNNMVNFFFLLHAFGAGNVDITRRLRRRRPDRGHHRRFNDDDVGMREVTLSSFDSSDQDDDNGINGDDNMSLVRNRRPVRVPLGRSGSRGRRRETNGRGR